MEGDGGVLWCRLPGHGGREGAAGQRQRGWHERIWDPRPASSAPSWKVTRAASGRCAGDCGRGGAAGQRRQRRHRAVSVPHAGQQRTHLEGHEREVNGVCQVTVAGKELLASAGEPGPADLGPQTGQQRTLLEGHQDGVWAVCPVTVAGRDCWPARAATARCGSGTPRRARNASRWKATRTGSTPCARSRSPGRTCWPAAGMVARCRIWDPEPASSAPPWRAARAASTLCAPSHRGREGAAGQRRQRRHGADLGPRDRPGTHHAGRTRTANGRCARSPWPRSSCWPAPALQHRADLGTRNWPAAPLLEGDHGSVWAVCPVTVAGEELLASEGSGGTVRIGTLGTGQQRATLESDRGGVRALCPVTVAGKQLLASADNGGMVRIWDPETGQQRDLLEGRGVWAVCRSPWPGRSR